MNLKKLNLPIGGLKKCWYYIIITGYNQCYILYDTTKETRSIQVFNQIDVPTHSQTFIEKGGDGIDSKSGNHQENSNPLRYKNEMAAIQAAKKYRKPLLGICRGHQVLAVEEGGSVGDNDINIGNNVLHQQGGFADYLR